MLFVLQMVTNSEKIKISVTGHSKHKTKLYLERRSCYGLYRSVYACCAVELYLRGHQGTDVVVLSVSQYAVAYF